MLGGTGPTMRYEVPLPVEGGPSSKDRPETHLHSLSCDFGSEAGQIQTPRAHHSTPFYCKKVTLYALSFSSGIETNIYPQQQSDRVLGHSHMALELPLYISFPEVWEFFKGSSDFFELC